MRVIATAGHVDHGKSALVEALTGTHPDRLIEEKEREMTIDLGFAYFQLPGGEPVAIVDVPGHRDFIENMLAGVGGVDAALVVIAADEGVMPQTREHLAILDLLGIHSGVVALTKADLVEDSEWLDLVRGEVERLLAPTGLAQSPILPVSARTRQGLEQLTRALSQVLAGAPRRPDLGRPRLPVDRAFTLLGFGTVVTGTLLDGTFQVGEEVEVLPEGRRARVRGLESHHQKIERAVPGSRVAMNLTGVEVDEVRRGHLIAHPGDYLPTQRLDLRVRQLAEAGLPLEHNQRVKLFLGTSEILARARILGKDQVGPGEEGWVQLELSRPAVAARGDHFILRRPSPGLTLGGGIVVEPHSPRRYRRSDPSVRDRLEALGRGNPADLLWQSALALGITSASELVERARLDESQARPALGELLADGRLVALGGPAGPDRTGFLIARPRWEGLMQDLVRLLSEYHQAHPLRSGMPREEARSQLGLGQKLLAPVLAQAVLENRILEGPRGIRLPEFHVHFSPAQQEGIKECLALFSREPFNPPSVKACQEALGEEVFAALVEQDRLRQVSAEVVFLRETDEKMEAEIRQMLTRKGTTTVAEVRDHFGTSRKYALAYLEHLDAIGITVRVGDERRLRNPSTP